MSNLQIDMSIARQSKSCINYVQYMLVSSGIYRPNGKGFNLN